MLAKIRNIYGTEDEEAARAFGEDAETICRHCDERIAAILGEAEGGSDGAAAALAYRYFKRVTAHASNVASAVLVPVGQLGYWDEDEV